MILKGLDKRSGEQVVSFISTLIKRGYYPDRILFKLFRNRDKVEFFSSDDWPKTRDEIEEILKYISYQGTSFLVINRMDLTIMNLEKYNARLIVEFIGDLEIVVRILEIKNLNNFNQEVIDREVERYKSFFLNLVNQYKNVLVGFDFPSGGGAETDREYQYYVDNEPEYVQNQLDYTNNEQN